MFVDFSQKHPINGKVTESLLRLASTQNNRSWTSSKWALGALLSPLPELVRPRGPEPCQDLSQLQKLEWEINSCVRENNSAEDRREMNVGGIFQKAGPSVKSHLKGMAMNRAF